MPLAIPSIVFPFSVWSKQLCVDGLVRGASVRIDATNGAITRKIVVAGPFASGGQVWVGLIAGESIKPGDTLRVAQSLAADKNELTPPGKAYAPSAISTDPDLFGKVRVQTRLFQCGTALWITGAVPGAELQVLQGGTALAKGAAPGGFARLALSSGMAASGANLEIRQAQPVAPFKVGAPVSSFPVAPRSSVVNSAGKLPDVVINGVPRACDPSIAIGNVVDGATVVVSRDSGVAHAVFDLSSLHFILSQPLKGGEKVSVVQQLCRDPVLSSNPVIIKVAVDGPLPAVGIAHICDDGAQCTLFNLRPGAEVEVKTGSKTVRLGVALDQTTYKGDLGIPVSGGTITVTQSMPGCPASPSPASTFTLKALDNTQPLIRGPVLECAPKLRLAGVTPLNEVEVRDAGTNGLLSAPRVVSFTATPVLDVTTLVAGQVVRAVAYACANHQDSDKVQVQPALLETRQAVLDEPIASMDSSLHVKNPVPFSTLTVTRPKGSGVENVITPLELSEDSATVPLAVKLNIGDVLTTQLQYCGQKSRTFVSKPVVRPRPMAPSISAPPASNVPLTGAQVKWSDPGLGTDAEAATFDIAISPAGISKTGLVRTTPTNSFVIPGSLAIATKQLVTITASNGSSLGSSSSSLQFTSLATPPVVVVSRSGQDLLIKVTACPPNAQVNLTGQEEHNVNQPPLKTPDGAVTVLQTGSFTVSRALKPKTLTSTAAGEAQVTLPLALAFDSLSLATKKGNLDPVNHEFIGLFIGSVVTVKAVYVKDASNFASGAFTWDGAQPVAA
jgi:hypothetical protein